MLKFASIEQFQTKPVSFPGCWLFCAPLYRQLCASLGITPGPKTPDGGYARKVGDRTFYVNMTGEAKDAEIDSDLSGLLSGKRWSGKLRLEPQGVELPEKNKSGALQT
jgi:hypothetical protein